MSNSTALNILLKAAFQQVPSALLITDRFGNVILHNTKWVQSFGQTLGTIDNLSEVLEAHGTALGRLRQTPILADDGQLLGTVFVFEDVMYEQQPRVIQKACHDLRSPLSAMMINASILSRDATVLNERRVTLATRILSIATRMNRMLDDLFDYAVAAQGKELTIRTSDADLKMIASETLAEIRAEHSGRTLVFETSGDLHGRWDPSRMRQMLHNLVAIALRRGSTRASLVVECAEVADPPSVEIRIRIKHDSLNVDLAMPDHSPTSPSDGFEPGLYIAKRIIEGHHGILDVSSPSNEATAFLIRLPKPRPTRMA